MNHHAFDVFMKNAFSFLEMKFSDAAYTFSFRMVKMSGYAFFSVRKTNNGSFEFYQSWRDYTIAAASILFSLYSVFGGITKSFDIDLKSVILNVGMMAFFQIAIIGTLVTKVNIFLDARVCFKILNEFKWIDRLVSGLKTSALTC